MSCVPTIGLLADSSSAVVLPGTADIANEVNLLCFVQLFSTSYMF